MIKLLKSINLRWSDLFLFTGICLFAPFLFFEQHFITNTNPGNVSFPLAAIVVCFILAFASWTAYLFFEKKNGNFKKSIPLLLLATIAIVNVIVICCQPSEVSIEMEAMNQPTHQIVPLFIQISSIHKAFFSLEIILICFGLLIAFTVLPKRFKSKDSVGVICWIGLVVFFVFIILLLLC